MFDATKSQKHKSFIEDKIDELIYLEGNNL